MGAKLGKEPRSDRGDTTLHVVRDRKGLARERLEASPVLVFPIEACVVELSTGGTVTRLDRAKLALVPPRVAFGLGGVSPVIQVVLVAIGPRAESTFFSEYGADATPDVLRSVLAEARVFPRTRWVDELCHRYVFERTVCEKHESLAARFLEVELVKEAYFLGKEALTSHTRASVATNEAPLVSKVRAHIDAHLFEEVSLADLCRAFGTSESTLLRTFRRETGTTPVEYTRARRLDEARLLLETGTYSASEVAIQVGYASLPAFTSAFSRKFGHAPSSLRKRGSRVVLPPHGEAPVRRARAKD